MYAVDPRHLNFPSLGVLLRKIRWLERNNPKGSNSLGNRGATGQKGFSGCPGADLRAPGGKGPAPPGRPRQLQPASSSGAKTFPLPLPRKCFSKVRARERPCRHSSGGSVASE